MLQNQYANEVEIIVYNHQKDMDFQMIDGWNWIMTSYGSVNSDNAVFEFMKDCVWIEITERKLVGGTDAWINLS